jgi:high-affinity Fe2+/Pb2+ permease
VSAAELLEQKAREYELMAVSHAERGELDDAKREHGSSAIAFTVVAIVLREVAEALEVAA